MIRVMDREQPVAAARRIVERRHPAARAAFVGGGAVTPRRTPWSDLDIVVILHGAPAPYRDSSVEDGWPVELFAHTEESWRAFVERETARRRSPLLFMCAEGRVVVDRDGVGARLATEARSRVIAGPPPVTQEERDAVRYGLTDLLHDLVAGPAAGEVLFIVSEVARRTAELEILSAGGWLGGGKWLARRADAISPGLAARLEEAVRAALDGDYVGLLALAWAALDRCGGPLWVGYRVSGVP
ncbi:nucleotidyltransferase domain-containing protein [Streptomyces sannanensis]|uniref:Nucleotidyltransferase domain-containing protein n=1 Tax=Streptomyces sannanensis TaxID=285536 RepID=A0ABP6S5T4_9ACTN